MTRVVRRYPEAPRFVREVHDEAAASNTAGEKAGLGIMRRNSTLLLHSEKQDPLLFIQAAADHTRDSPKEKRTDGLFSSRLFALMRPRSWTREEAFTNKAFAATSR